VLSLPYYNPVRLVESMNQLDQLTKGHTLYGLGSGFPGIEPAGLGIDAEYHRSGRAAEDSLDIVEKIWAFRTGDPELVFKTPVYSGSIKRRVAPAPYHKAHPTVIRTASRDSSVIKAAQKGLPAFLGTFSAESPLVNQAWIYRKALAEAGHSQAMVEECLRWSTVDWLAVVVADTDEEAQRRGELAKAEHLAMRKAYNEQFGAITGPSVSRRSNQSAAAAYAAGGDMHDMIAGTPDTVAKKVQELADIGINHLLVRFLGEWPGETRYISEGSMKLFSKEVLPRFKDLPALRDPLALDLSAMA
jgi:alkanesulfonate monooxygenase SsuD/methylene tetrahydromethanopterin reductase-like flavin-dependent oxidoreductase (luciferase family)